jgi:hypothetical protein
VNDGRSESTSFPLGPMMASIRSGRFIIQSVFRDAGADLGDVHYIRSTDGGVTFAARLKLDTDSTIRPQWQPNLSVSPTGTLLATWYDTRESTSCTSGKPYRSLLPNVVAQVQR